MCENDNMQEKTPRCREDLEDSGKEQRKDEDMIPESAHAH